MSISESQKKRGRPATGQTPPYSIRLPADLEAKISAYAASQMLSRAEAMRVLMETGLAALDAQD